MKNSNKKLTLNALRVKSFVTVLDGKGSGNLKGGNGVPTPTWPTSLTSNIPTGG